MAFVLQWTKASPSAVLSQVYNSPLEEAAAVEAVGGGPEDPVADVIAGAIIASALIEADSSGGQPPPGKGSGGGGGDCDPCKGLRDQLRKHEQKLQDYTANPTAHDNRGFLGRGYDQRVIAGRIRSLQNQIANFRKQLEECERKHGSGNSP